MTQALPLTHDDLARWRTCPRAFWQHRRSPSGSLPVQKAKASPLAEQAIKASFPQAISIDTPHTDAQWAQAIARTQASLAEGWLAGRPTEGSPDEGRAILGACFLSNEGVRVRIDVLTTGPYGVRLFKVRFATVGDDGDIDQVALWTHIAARSGLRIQSAGLLLVDTDFVYPGLGCYAGLFREAELMPVLGSRPVAQWIVAMRRCEQSDIPEVPPEPPCREPKACVLTSLCGTQSLARTHDDATDLAIVGRELATELKEMGHRSVLTVPMEELPDDRRRRAVRAVKQGRAILEPQAASAVSALPYPRIYLRMDTIGFAIPIWPGTHPYQVMPFQWSCDIELTPGQHRHLAFLATAQGDPRRAFATTLLDALGSAGSILAYNAGFERNRLRELAIVFPDLAALLLAAQARIVDLYQIARAHYYHPRMCGSWSFKSLVRAMAADAGADLFQWRDQDEAQEAFALSLQGQLSRAELDELRQALLAYGQRQTHALRQITQCFEQARVSEQKA